MTWLALFALALFLLAGACPGPRPFQCDCQACWYVAEVPEGVLPCTRKLFRGSAGGHRKALWLLLGGSAALALLAFMRSKRGKPATWIDAWVEE